MGEKIIQPPFYNSRFYDTGAGGGGADVDYKYIYSIFSAGGSFSITLDDVIPNKDASIVLDVFCKSTSTYLVYLYDESNSQKGFFRKTSGAWSASNGTGAQGTTTAANSAFSRLVMYNEYASVKDGILNLSIITAPFSEFNIKKIDFINNAQFSRFAISKTNLLNSSLDADYIIDLRPYKKEGLAYLVDMVSGNMYNAPSGDCW